MKEWLKQNIIQMISILVLVTFGYANFTKDISANADQIETLDKRLDKYESKTDEKLDKAIKLLERIDERTKGL